MRAPPNAVSAETWGHQPPSLASTLSESEGNPTARESHRVVVRLAAAAATAVALLRLQARPAAGLVPALLAPHMSMICDHPREPTGPSAAVAPIGFLCGAASGLSTALSSTAVERLAHIPFASNFPHC